MAQTFEVDFDLTSTNYDQGFGKIVQHTITSRQQFMGSIEPKERPAFEGQLSVYGVDLKPGQKITATFTIED